MHEKFIALLFSLVVLSAPFLANFTKVLSKRYRFSANIIAGIMVFCLCSVIIAYAILVRYTLQQFSLYLQIDWWEFMEGPLTGKGLLLYTIALFTVYCGWYFLLYPVTRDFEQLRKEVSQRGKNQKH